jgi:Tol biopolymer transport system component
MRPSLVVFTLVVTAILMSACGSSTAPQSAQAPAPDTPTLTLPSATLIPAADTPVPPTDTPLPTRTPDWWRKSQPAPKPTNTSRPSPTRVVTSNEIAYSSQMTGELQLYNLDTKRVTVLAKDHAMWTPRCWDWSPDGTRLLYADNQEVNGEWVSPLTVLDLESAERTVLPYKDTCAKWHPNSRAIVVVTYDDNTIYNTTIRHHFVDARTGEAITEITSRKYGFFNFSPDGKWMVMNTRDRDNQLHFFPIELDQSGQVAAVGEVKSQTINIGNRFIGPPQWSPTGDKIAFISLNNFDFDNADIYVVSIEYNASGELVLANMVETNMTQGFNKQEGVRYEELNWSPWGDQIAFWTYTPEKLSEDSWSLVKPRVFVMPLDGSGIIEITDSTYPVGQTPEWSPDGNKLVFTAGDQYQRSIVICDPDGSDKKRLQIESSSLNATFRPNPQLSPQAHDEQAQVQPEPPISGPTAAPATAAPAPPLRRAQMTRLQISAPTAQRGMLAVYESARNVIVLFGGTDGQNKILDQTWEFDGNNWKQINTPTKPPARFWQGMAYDSDRKVVVMFGGNKNHNGQLLNDTWEYGGQDWKQVGTANRPVETGVMPGMAYDSCRKKMVLISHRSRMSDSLPSTWEFDGKDWVDVQPRGRPETRTLTAMVFDAQRCKMVLFGGMDQRVTGYADTWEYDGKSWRERITTTSPTARWAHAMTYDPASGKVMLYGGYGPQHPNGKALRDTWVYNGEDWEQISLSSNFAVEQHILTFDPQSRTALLYAHGQTWKLNPGSAMVAPEAPAAPALNCALGYTRLAVGKNAQPAGPISLANNIRSEPKISDNIIAAFTPGMFVKILEGPVCADGFVFWKVESRFIPGGTGWTAEGDGKQYFLEPLQ